MGERSRGSLKRVQRKRKRGWRMPPETVYVGRPTRWGNPFLVGDVFTRMQAVAAYRSYIETMIESKPEIYDLGQLRGKNLACWCPLNQPCHADVLLELARQFQPAQ
ncbi:MAG: DUF4326 domain-containing protein [Candidatus Latescibacterota bacterium]|nr:MAG: DUF4326 domain-containing protein [Candidatus Latescibacterota bacterium]